MRVIRSWTPMHLAQLTLDWIDERIGLRGLITASLHVTIPRSAHTYYLGGITLFFFMSQAVTGILLSLYYRASPESAYDSVLFIMNQVNFGWLIRSVHAWGANLMIVFCILHMLRVVVQGAYKAPREVTWLAGIALLFVTLGFGFTGYLLPWDQRAYWATTVGTEIPGAVPFIGSFLRDLMRGGADVSAVTLTRFFGIHMLVLPASLAGVLMAHLFIIHQQGLADPKEDETKGAAK
ncbi:MAG: cytochrome b N-terminal domain-containing protein [Chloroflexi bacterium]|nr:cytochrome b N-terminal domain-containing protein [Chloroflexota bacterium]